MSHDDKRLAEIDDLFQELDMLLKNSDVGEALAALGVNVSLALVGAAGLHAYLRGQKAVAVEELGTMVEEIAARMTLTASVKGQPS
jgi:hypothetical protein